jgi:hypothetical protein
MRFLVFRLCLPPWLVQVEENLATRSGFQTAPPSTQGGWRAKDRCLPLWLVQVEANLVTRSGPQTSLPSTRGGWRAILMTHCVEHLPAKRFEHHVMNLTSSHCHRFESIMNRRQLLQRAGGGFGGLALAQLMASQGVKASDDINPLAPQASHFPAQSEVDHLAVHGGGTQFGRHV